jgi:hypothetical protein
MFISKVEKLKLISSMMDLMATVQKLDSEVIYLKGKIKTLEGQTKEAKQKKPRKQSTMSAEGRARIGAAVKAYHANKKLEKQNATSISTTSI